MAVLVVMLSSCVSTSDPLADPVGSPVAAVVQDRDTDEHTKADQAPAWGSQDGRPGIG